MLFYCDGSDHDEQAHPLLRDKHLETMQKLMDRGVGFVAVHYTVFVPAKRGGEQFLDWIGGYFDYRKRRRSRRAGIPRSRTARRRSRRPVRTIRSAVD